MIVEDHNILQQERQLISSNKCEYSKHLLQRTLNFFYEYSENLRFLSAVTQYDSDVATITETLLKVKAIKLHIDFIHDALQNKLDFKQPSMTKVNELNHKNVKDAMINQFETIDYDLDNSSNIFDAISKAKTCLNNCVPTENYKRFELSATKILSVANDCQYVYLRTDDGTNLEDYTDTETHSSSEIEKDGIDINECVLTEVDNHCNEMSLAHGNQQIDQAISADGYSNAVDVKGMVESLQSVNPGAVNQVSPDAIDVVKQVSPDATDAVKQVSPDAINAVKQVSPELVVDEANQVSSNAIVDAANQVSPDTMAGAINQVLSDANVDANKQASPDAIFDSAYKSDTETNSKSYSPCSSDYSHCTPTKHKRKKKKTNIKLKEGITKSTIDVQVEFIEGQTPTEINKIPAEELSKQSSVPDTSIPNYCKPIGGGDINSQSYTPKSKIKDAMNLNVIISMGEKMSPFGDIEWTNHERMNQVKFALLSSVHYNFPHAKINILNNVIELTSPNDVKDNVALPMKGWNTIVTFCRHVYYCCCCGMTILGDEDLQTHLEPRSPHYLHLQSAELVFIRYGYDFYRKVKYNLIHCSICNEVYHNSCFQRLHIHHEANYSQWRHLLKQ